MVEKMHFEAIQLSVKIMTACFQHVSVYGVLGADTERSVHMDQRDRTCSSGYSARKKDTAWQNQEMFFQL